MKMVAPDRIAVIAQIRSSYLPGGANVHCRPALFFVTLPLIPSILSFLLTFFSFFLQGGHTSLKIIESP